MRRYLFPLSCILFLASCEVGPDYARPDVDTPAAFKESGAWQKAQPGDAIDRGAWWSVYNDPLLDALEKQVDVSNQNLKAAEAAYRAATAATDQVRATLFPTLTANGGATRSGTGQPHTTANAYTIDANASWAPDVWGRIRRSIESSEANAAASAADLAAARLSAQAQLATDYFDLRVQDELKRMLAANVEADKKILAIVKNRYAAGVAAESDVLLAQTQWETTQAAAVNADVSRAALEHAIAVLMGKAPAEFALEPEAGKTYLIPNIPAEVPSAILQRRPDIAAAERLAAAANAQIGVAEAAWYPDLTLSASYGYMSAVLGKLLQASSNVWSFGPSLAETIFDAGARQAAVEQARATFDQSIATYRQTVLTAFQQVEDNLAALRILADQAKINDAAVADARKSEQIALNQYKQGIVPFNNVLTAQVATLGAEQTALSVLGTRLQDSVALIQALGGGWDADQLKVNAH